MKSLLEFLTGFNGILQLEGKYHCTTETTRKNDEVVDHTRFDNRGFVIHGVHVHPTKAELYLKGLDTTARLEDNRYAWRNLVCAINFTVPNPIRYNAGGWKNLETSRIFPDVNMGIYDKFVGLYSRFQIALDYMTKAIAQTKVKNPSVSKEKTEEFFRIETPVQYWSLNNVVEKPRYSWKDKSVEEINLIIMEQNEIINELSKKLVEITGLNWLSTMEPIFQFRSVELGLIESFRLVGDSSNIILDETFEPSYVTRDEFETLISKGEITTGEYAGRDKSVKIKGILKVPKVPFATLVETVPVTV